MKKLFIMSFIWAVYFLCTAGVVVAQERENWILLIQNQDKNIHLFVDQDSIRRLPANIIRVLVRYEYKKPYSGKRSYDCKKCSLSKRLSNMNITEEFDCKERKLKILRLTEYYIDAAPHTEQIGETWKYVTPKSIDEIIFNYVCKQKAG